MELSKEEQHLLQDREFFIVKARINTRLDEVFSSMKESWSDQVGQWPLPSGTIDTTRGKIFRGENYKGFPYTMMDYPRSFSKESVFAVRTLCWWGHEFSVTLHVQGDAFCFYAERLEQRLERLKDSQLHFCTGESPWDYEFSSVNYTPIGKIDCATAAITARDKGFVKLSLRIGLDEMEELEKKGTEAIALFAKFLKD